MKTVRDACQLQPNALSIKLSDQIEQLDELIHAAGDGDEYFAKTFITQGMKDLVTEGNFDCNPDGMSLQAMVCLIVCRWWVIHARLAL